jgi:hypothetical protein
MMKGNLSQRLWCNVNKLVNIKNSNNHVSSCIQYDLIQGTISQGGDGISVGDYAQVLHIGLKLCQLSSYS